MLWFCEEVRSGVRVGFTDRTSGNLAFHVGDDRRSVIQNRAVLQACIDKQTAPGLTTPFQYMNQIHGNHVAVVDAETSKSWTSGPSADAMVSRTHSLAVMVADCVPVVFVGLTEEASLVVGVAHAGRPGVEKRVIAATAKELRANGAVDIQAWLGPSVCGRCYEVPEEMRSAVTSVAPAAYAVTSWGTPALDLPAAVREQLESAGIRVRNVGKCTLEHPELFSHRRAVQTGDVEGRFIGFVTIPSLGNL